MMLVSSGALSGYKLCKILMFSALSGKCWATVELIAGLQNQKKAAVPLKDHKVT